jgi:hypothetical protein
MVTIQSACGHIMVTNTAASGHHGAALASVLGATIEGGMVTYSCCRVSASTIGAQRLYPLFNP